VTASASKRTDAAGAFALEDIMDSEDKYLSRFLSRLDEKKNVIYNWL
jgi:hypothetical protein